MSGIQKIKGMKDGGRTIKARGKGAATKGFNFVVQGVTNAFWRNWWTKRW